MYASAKPGLKYVNITPLPLPTFTLVGVAGASGSSTLSVGASHCPVPFSALLR